MILIYEYQSNKLKELKLLTSSKSKQNVFVSIHVVFCLNIGKAGWVYATTQDTRIRI